MGAVQWSVRILNDQAQAQRDRATRPLGCGMWRVLYQFPPVSHGRRRTDAHPRQCNACRGRRDPGRHLAKEINPGASAVCSCFLTSSSHKRDHPKVSRSHILGDVTGPPTIAKFRSLDYRHSVAIRGQRTRQHTGNKTGRSNWPKRLRIGRSTGIEPVSKLFLTWTGVLRGAIVPCFGTAFVEKGLLERKGLVQVGSSRNVLRKAILPRSGTAFIEKGFQEGKGFVQVSSSRNEQRET